FFQAEDGIRDLTVTGVQTCALPIFRRGQGTPAPPRPARRRSRDARPEVGAAADCNSGTGSPTPDVAHRSARACGAVRETRRLGEIGRASCRERGWIWVVAVAVKKRG